MGNNVAIGRDGFDALLQPLVLQHDITILVHQANEISPPGLWDKTLALNDFLEVGAVKTKFNRQPIRADGRPLCEELAKVVGEDKVSVHWSNIYSFDCKMGSKLRVYSCYVKC